MRIVRIFADQLFAFQYENEFDNELSRLLKLWNDTSYLFQFVTENKLDIPSNLSITKVINQIIESANAIDDILNLVSNDESKRLEEFFKPLHNHEYSSVVLSKQKGRNQNLRIYAIKISDNCFVVTGGAIKFHHLNNQRQHTEEEMKKLDRCKNFLIANNVMDADSFFELLNEES